MERTEFAWGAFVLAMLLIIWLLPIQVFRTTLVLVVAGAIGFVVLRRQVVSELVADREAAPTPLDVPPPDPG
jgi:hypothetical protein